MVLSSFILFHNKVKFINLVSELYSSRLYGGVGGLDIFDWLKASPLRKNVARIKNFITLPTSNSIIGFYFLNNEKCIFFSSNSSHCAGHLLLQ